MAMTASTTPSSGVPMRNSTMTSTNAARVSRCERTARDSKTR
jgi:hypothetical protein